MKFCNTMCGPAGRVFNELRAAVVLHPTMNTL